MYFAASGILAPIEFITGQQFGRILYRAFLAFGKNLIKPRSMLAGLENGEPVIQAGNS
ncbi:MAG: hypothetical protein A4E53_04393 [Pelotomaculum sp. PtaB.Bin104]|nr:MAG: hypothetical protein A4E53_04393 [Pelotomaculum sp. PtaB.Bin104]